METKCLFSEYRQVETFGPDQEYESEEEVVYVTLDLGTIEPTLVPSSSTYCLIGLDTPTPFLQLSGTIFKGQHQRLLGTELLFADSKEEHHDRNRKPLEHVGITEQRIRFKEVELREKVTGSSDVADTAQTTTKGKSKRHRAPESVEEVTGSSSFHTVTRTRGGRGGKASKTKDKGKGKERPDRPPQESDDDDNILTVREADGIAAAQDAMDAATDSVAHVRGSGDGQMAGAQEHITRSMLDDDGDGEQIVPMDVDDQAGQETS
ncbi:uncharacterized protein FIBRA_03933 [Fibroporia radiculosa]|uniref:Transcription factor TFIIIC triple barrel domain-containing protein n=1 Tax=Fibroporia radiculosa TaxID=599839 RepID=J4HW93_9APHY|nr:uncharacterized protein FIBRA_03933 [Fibroporia radiculosa]CCM01862.1 predicted protein [Fibroporia radiculosa]